MLTYARPDKQKQEKNKSWISIFILRLNFLILNNRNVSLYITQIPNRRSNYQDGVVRGRVTYQEEEKFIWRRRGGATYLEEEKFVKKWSER